MVDTIDSVRRSENMRRIRSTDTKPELRLRRLIYGLGFRYRLHRRNLPGNPDIVFASRKKVIFVHGCFWHQHEKCMDGRLPKSKTDYWTPKLKRNVERDASALQQLQQLGWSTLVVWDCELSSIDTLKQTEEKVHRFLTDDRVATT